MSEIKTITVNQGDTLSQIAKANNTTVEDILRINKDISDPNLILVGQEIKIEEMNFDNVDQVPVETENISVVNDSNNIDNSQEVNSNNDTVEEIEVLDNPTINPENNVSIENNQSSLNSSVENSDYVQSVQNVFNESSARTKTDYMHRCGALVSDQLTTLGIVDRAKASTNYGKDLAKVLATGAATINGHSAIGYDVNNSNQKQVFENIVNENNGNLNNLVISFNKGGDFSSDAGHVMLIHKIDNGQVYFVDNWKRYRSGNGYKATSLSINEFEDQYLKASNSANYMTHLI